MTNGPLCGPFVFGANAAARAAPICATWRDDRPPGPYFCCLLESRAKFFSTFNCVTNRRPTSSAKAGFCPVISLRSTTTWAVHGVVLLLNLAPARCSAVCGQNYISPPPSSGLACSSSWLSDLLPGTYSRQTSSSATSNNVRFRPEPDVPATSVARTVRPNPPRHRFVACYLTDS